MKKFPEPQRTAFGEEMPQKKKNYQKPQIVSYDTLRKVTGSQPSEGPT